MVSPTGLNTNSNVSVYNISDPEEDDLDNMSFVTTFLTPGIARAVSLFNGQAYVVDHANGMHVVNYRAFDIGGVPTASKEDALTALVDGISVTSGEITEGKRFVLQAHVQDDVQLRNVELFANGVRIVADGSFPFETAYRIPLNMVGETITFTGIARDTGGNSLDIGPLSFAVVGDIEPPVVQIDLPQDGDTVFRYDPPYIEVRRRKYLTFHPCGYRCR